MSYELAEQYGQLTDEEIIILAADRDQLTPEASETLDTELSRRGIVDESVRQFQARRTREIERAELKAVEKTAARSDRRYCGKFNLKVLRDGKIHEYDATLFITFAYIPVVPLGTYRVREFRTGSWFGNPRRVISKLNFDWEQVLATWVKSATIALALLLLLRFAIVPALR